MPLPKKSDEDRIRRNKPVVKATLPEWDGVVRGPELPDKAPDGRDWSEHTIRWYEKWRRSPQAMFTMDTDWESLFMAAVIHNITMYGVSHTALVGLTGEIRKREGSFGGSIEDRRRIGMGDAAGSEVHEETAFVQKETRKVVNYFERLGNTPS